MRPVSVYVDTHCTGKISDAEITAPVNMHFDLRRSIYKQTAAYCHFGRGDLNLL